MSYLDFKLYLANPDIQMKLAIKSDSNEYYEYVLLHTNNALVVSENAKPVLRNKISKYFELKE